MNRESFVFYASWLEAIKNLPREMQGEVLVAIVEYGITGEMPADLKPIAKALMAMVKPQIDANRVKYENGKKGGRKPNENQTETKTKPNENQNETKEEPNLTKPEPNVNVYVNDNVIKEKDNKKKNVRFSPPTIEEVKQFIAEKGYSVNAESFFSYYESNGWMVGRNKMKKWQAAVAKWHNTNYGEPKADIGVVLRAEPNKYDNDEELWGSSI